MQGDDWRGPQGWLAVPADPLLPADPRGAAGGSESCRTRAWRALQHLLTPAWELQWRVLMIAPASSIIFRMVPPWTFPAMLASSGRMILPGKEHESSHPPAMPPGQVPAQPPGGTAITLPDELPGHLTTLMPATSPALPARGFLRAAVETALNYCWEWKEASLLCRAVRLLSWHRSWLPCHCGKGRLSRACATARPGFCWSSK